MSSTAKTHKPKSKRKADLCMLFDGHSLAYRAFHALPETMATSSGQVTNMVFGFLSSFFKFLNEHQPDLLAVCFDLPQPTFRHQKYADYKGTRPKAPEIFIQQLELLREILSALGVTVIDAPGYEADDLLATLAVYSESKGIDVIVVTGDRDCFQLIKDPGIKLLYTSNRDSNAKLFDEKSVADKVGVTPEEYLQYAALKGDASDNLPGVAGVGEKTGARLIKQYQDIRTLYKKLEGSDIGKLPEITPRLKVNLLEHKDLVFQNLELMALREDVHLDVTLDQLVINEDSCDPEEINRLFNLLELQKFKKEVKEFWGFEPEIQDAEELRVTVKKLDSPKKAADYILSLTSKDPAIAAAWLKIKNESREFLGMAVSGGPETSEAVWISNDLLDSREVKKALSQVFGKEDAKPVSIYEAKSLIRELLKRGVEIRSLAFDLRLAVYVINPQDGNLDFGELSARYGKIYMPEIETKPPEEAAALPGINDYEMEIQTAALQALGSAKLKGHIHQFLSERGEEELYLNMEIPLVFVLAKMEHWGIAINTKELESIDAKLAAASEEQRKIIEKFAAEARGEHKEDFNVNSTKQLAQLLFEDLGLTPQKRTKTGYSTDTPTLEKLKSDHPIIEHILEYRSVEKLHTTYGQGLRKVVGSDGRIHSTFNQTVARTGRLSSDAPNLHNIPIRTEMGRAFRKIFVAEKGFKLLVADYNQIELRCIAHLCGDSNLVAAFKSGEDVHTSVAKRVFGVDPVPYELRERAKMISYGLIYGMEAYGLAQRLDIPRKEAGKILDSFFKAYPSVADYMNEAVENARKLGYTETLFGRRRYIPELNSKNTQVRAAAERQAMNSAIQGLAADIFKNALLGIHSAVENKKMASRLILQVHDEVILEVEASEIDAAQDLVLEKMQGAAKLVIPLVVELSYGRTWAEAKN